jgi:hypothetical protein
MCIQLMVKDTTMNMDCKWDSVVETTDKDFNNIITT